MAEHTHKLIPAYCSLGFLEDISSRHPIDYMDPDRILEGKTHFEILDLFFNGFAVKTDCSKEKISEKEFNPLIKHLMKNARIVPAESDFKEIREDADKFFNRSNSEPISVFFLTGADMCIDDYIEKSGKYFFHPKSKLNVLFNEGIQNFEPDEKQNWKFANHFFNPHHSLVIADPYLYNETAIMAIKELLNEIIPRKLKTKYYISFVGSLSKSKDPEEKVKENIKLKENMKLLKEDITNELERLLIKTPHIECHLVTGDEFHDRYIITNNICIFSGYGLGIIKKGLVKKESTWVGIRPYKFLSDNDVYFYAIMREKLTMIKKWIDKSNKETLNPLLNLNNTK